MPHGAAPHPEEGEFSGQALVLHWSSRSLFCCLPRWTLSSELEKSPSLSDNCTVDFWIVLQRGSADKERELDRVHAAKLPSSQLDESQERKKKNSPVVEIPNMGRWGHARAASEMLTAEGTGGEGVSN